MTNFATISTITVAGKEVKGFVVAPAVIVSQDLGKFFDVASQTISNIVVTHTARVYVVSGVNHKVFMVEEGTEFDSMKNFRTFQFFCHVRLQNSAMSFGTASKINELQLMEYLEAEVEEEETPATEPVQEEVATEEPPVQEAPPVVEVHVPEAPKPVVKTRAIQHGSVVKFGLGEVFFGVPSTMIHEATVEHTKGTGFTAVYVSLKKDVAIEGFAGTFGAETAEALMYFVGKNTQGQLPAGFVSPEMLVQQQPVPAADGETPKADKSIDKKEESVPMQTVNHNLLANMHKRFTTVAKTGSVNVVNRKALRIKGADKSPQSLSLQILAKSLQGFLWEDGKMLPINMISVFDPEFAMELQAEGKLEGINAETLKQERLVTRRNADGTTYHEPILTYNDNVFFVATENNKIEFMKIKEEESSFIFSNESEQSRVASRGKYIDTEVYTSTGEVARLRVQDATNLAVTNFNTDNPDGLPFLLMNHLFDGNGVFVRTREASENILELKGLHELVQFTTSNDTPSQKRQAKVTFIANTPTFNVYDFLKEMGNDIRAYAKKVRKEIAGKYGTWYELDAQKNATRLGLLGSASKPLAGFPEAVGLYASKEVVSSEFTIATTSTGVKIGLAPDVKSMVRAAAKVFNSDISKVAPGHPDANPSIKTMEDFLWEVNTTDGGAIFDADFIAPLLENGKFVNRVRNGRLRGYTHQFREKHQNKGLDVVSEWVKKLTGLDIILFAGARKTDLLSMLEAGEQLEYHVMLVASTFKEDSVASISAQAMNNLNINHELLIKLATENVEKAKQDLNNVEKRDEAIAMIKDGKDVVDMLSAKNVLSKPFGIEKFVAVNPIVWKDLYAKLEINAEILDYIKTHKGGYLYTNAKNNYMFSDLYAILKAVQDRTFVIKEEHCAAKKGEVILPMMDKNGRRYFYEGEIMSIRSPHVVNDETQFADAIDPVQYAESVHNTEMAEFWAYQLEKGYLDGVTFFSCLDIMVMASSGADFDGDTSLIVLKKEIIDAVNHTPQYVNFHTLTDEDKPGYGTANVDTSNWAYELNVDGTITGGWTLNGKLATEKQKAAAEAEGLQLKRSMISSEIFGEGCPWKDPKPAAAFPLPEGIYQDGYKIYVPEEKVDTKEAYKAWVDSMHVVIRDSISSSDIGQTSNIVMAITNAINYVEILREKAIAEDKPNSVMAYNSELKYLTNMREVFVAITWYVIDAAKHGGAYKEYLKKWMGWTTQKGMKREMDKGYTRSMRRVLGWLAKSVDINTGEQKQKRGIILPNVMRWAKSQYASVPGNRETNIQLYAQAMSKMYVEADKEKNNMSPVGNNILSVTYGLLNGATDFNAGLAKQIYAYYSNLFENGDTDRGIVGDRAYSKEVSNMKQRTAQYLSEELGLDYASMNHGKQTAWTKKLNPNYQQVRMAQKTWLGQVRQAVCMELIKHNMDVVKFAAVAYNSAYETAMKAEKTKANSNPKAPIYALWKLLDQQMIVMLGSIEGARILPAEDKNVIMNLNSMYFIPTAEFNVKAQAAKKAKSQKGLLEGKVLVMVNSPEGMFVHLVDTKDASATNENKIGECRGQASFQFVSEFSYRSEANVVTNINDNGINVDFGVIRCFGTRYEGAEPQLAKALYDRTASARYAYPAAVHSAATAEDLKIKEGTKFVLVTNNQGVTYIGLEEEGKMKPVAKLLKKTVFKAGNVYEIDAEFSDASGQLAVYIYDGKEKQK